MAHQQAAMLLKLAHRRWNNAIVLYRSTPLSAVVPSDCSQEASQPQCQPHRTGWMGRNNVWTKQRGPLPPRHGHCCCHRHHSGATKQSKQSQSQFLVRYRRCACWEGEDSSDGRTDAQEGKNNCNLSLPPCRRAMHATHAMQWKASKKRKGEKSKKINACTASLSIHGRVSMSMYRDRPV